MNQLYARWSLEWFSKNKLDGITRHLIFEDTKPVFFKTRKEAREFAEERYGYIRSREDLKREPHGWTIPRLVKIISIKYKSPSGEDK